MDVAKASRVAVLNFYRSFYRSSERSEFLCGGNDIFMHPVLTPNFFCGQNLEAVQLLRNHSHFVTSLRQRTHWVQLYQDQIGEILLAEAGYRQIMKCAFNIFFTPMTARPVAGYRWQTMERISGELRAVYENKVEANCHNLPPTVLNKIEAVLQQSSEHVRHVLAFSEKNLSAAVTVARAGGVSLFVNAWVDLPDRHRGVMSALFAKTLEQEFAAGQTAAFYWTLNPLLAAKGDRIDSVRVFERQ